VFGRAADHGRGDDHVTRAFGAIDRGHGIDGGGHHERRIEREAGECRGGREPAHGKAAGPKPKTPDVALGVRPAVPASGHNAGDASRDPPQPTLRLAVP